MSIQRQDFFSFSQFILADIRSFSECWLIFFYTKFVVCYLLFVSLQVRYSGFI